MDLSLEIWVICYTYETYLVKRVAESHISETVLAPYESSFFFLSAYSFPQIAPKQFSNKDCYSWAGVQETEEKGKVEASMWNECMVNTMNQVIVSGAYGFSELKNPLITSERSERISY